MSENIKKTETRDYSKPIMINFKGIEGHKAYIKMVTTPQKKYNAEDEAKKAAENLRKQGISL